MRNLLYKIARIMGDINAIVKGRIIKRGIRRLAGKIAGQQLGRWFN